MARIAPKTQSGADAAHVMSVMLRKIAGFSGLVHENMYRATGWNFLTIGRAVERAAMTADLLVGIVGDKGPQGGLDLAIEVGDSVMIHRQTHALFASRDSVIHLLALDAANPRSIRFQAEVIARRIEDISRLIPKDETLDLQDRVAALQGAVQFSKGQDLTKARLAELHGMILSISTALHMTFIR